MERIKIFNILIVLCCILTCFNALEIKRPGFLSRKSYQKLEDSIYDYESLTVPEIIESFGYPVEVHHVTTEDGYILEVHRIPYGINPGPTEGERPVVLLQHGLLVSSFDWIADRPDRALAYILADYGYDVWINNIRGNAYSRNHTTLDPDVDKEEFWAFTYDEMGTYDVPASINYALATTGADQIYYVGFSMGTTMFFVMMSERPEIAEKIKAASLLAPVVYMNNIRGILKPLAPYSAAVDARFSAKGHYEVRGTKGHSSDTLNKFCSEGNATAPLCYSFLYLICGFDPIGLNKELYPVVLAHEPGGTSFHTVNHYAQQILTDVFQKYDWGAEENLKRYGQETPPPLNLQGPMPPLGLFVGPNDFLGDPTDVDRLVEEVQNLQLYYLVDNKRWNHIDFCWGTHAKEYVYDHVVEYFSTFQQQQQ